MTHSILRVYSYTGPNAYQDAIEAVCERLRGAVSNKCDLEMDFRRVQNVMPSFLVQTIGQVFREYPAEFRRYITFINCPFEDELFAILFREYDPTQNEFSQGDALRTWRKNVEEARG